MKRENIGRAVLIALVIAAGLVVAAPSTPAQGRRLPTFEVDRAWPKVPPQWRVGDASSIAIDAKDNVWVLHRPRTGSAETLVRRMACPGSSRLRMTSF